jgi:hypothetical protein
VTGVTSSEGGAFAGALFQYVPIDNGVYEWGAARGFGAWPGESTVVSIDIPFDQPQEFVLYMYATAQVWDWSPGSAATSDFSHTAVLQSVRVYDSAGVELQEFKLSAASGTDYVNLSPVPEPATFTAMMAGLAGLCLVLHGRRRAESRPAARGEAPSL